MCVARLHAVPRILATIPYSRPPRLASSARRLEALVSPAALLTEHGVACLADAVCALLQGRPPDHLLRLISGQSRVISGHLGSSGRPPDHLLRVDAELEPAQVGHEPCSRERRGEMGRGRVFPGDLLPT